MNEKKNGLALASQIIAIVVFSLTFAGLLGAVISDIVILANNIILFVSACLAGAITFVFALIVCFLTIVLIFGIFLLDNYGFWPAQWAGTVFRGILQEAAITHQQVQTLIIIRIILIVVCALSFVGAIVSLSLRKVAKNKGSVTPKIIKPFAILTIVFSVLGLIVGAGAIVLFSAL